MSNSTDDDEYGRRRVWSRLGTERRGTGNLGLHPVMGFARRHFPETMISFASTQGIVRISFRIPKCLQGHKLTLQSYVKATGMRRLRSERATCCRGSTWLPLASSRMANRLFRCGSFQTFQTYRKAGREASPVAAAVAAYTAFQTDNRIACFLGGISQSV
jgi:hypothetical protein